MSVGSIGQVVERVEAQTKADVRPYVLPYSVPAEAVVERVAAAPAHVEGPEDEAIELGRGAMIGVAFGIPIGGAIASGVMAYTVPDLGLAPTISLGMLIGGFWGIFFGGLGGVVPKVLARSH